MSARARIDELLSFVYGASAAPRIHGELRQRLERFAARVRHEPATGLNLDATDVVVITYGDQVREEGRPPLVALASFLDDHLQGVIAGVHILPFYPWSSDDGFSVVDYAAIDPELGSWEDVERIGAHYRLMVDGVFNHISSQSEWFRRYRLGDSRYARYFVEVEPETDLTQVFRPRPGPPWTEVETDRGSRRVWATFSADQIDLNFAEPRVLLEVVDALLLYVLRGARVIRLDAIAFLWKEPGTRCLHHPKTHAVVKLLRAVLDEVAPGVLLITETNVPHEENISYFGDLLPELGRTDEAQLVYQFPLAPLSLHTFQTGDARALTSWAQSLPEQSSETTFFNFIASHDGIGVVPARGLLSEEEISTLVERVRERGGRASMRAHSDGSESVYELNTTLWDALADPHRSEPELDERRFLASQVLLLSLAGVPAIYFHSLLGSSNDQTGMERTGRARTINRQKLERGALEAMLADADRHQGRVFAAMRRLISERCSHSAFDPAARQRVLELDPAVFAVVRGEGPEAVLCLVNAADRPRELEVRLSELSLPAGAWRDRIGMGGSVSDDGDGLRVTLEGCQSMWLRH